MSERLKQLIQKIDNANAADPNLELTPSGEQLPATLLYGQRMTTELTEFVDTPSETLQIAARAQHIERWKSPRSDYPDGRAGYKKWRTDLGKFHAQQTARLMEQSGYDETNIETVKKLLQKHELKRNPEMQCLEDVICIVFLKYYFQPFALKHADEKIISILVKTWNKMSENGHAAALKINFPENLANLVKKALGQE